MASETELDRFICGSPMAFECISFLTPSENHNPGSHFKHFLAFLHSFTICRYLNIVKMKNIRYVFWKSVFRFCSTLCFWDVSIIMWLARVHPVFLLYYIIVWTYHSWFIHFNVGDYMGCFLFLLQWAMLQSSDTWCTCCLCPGVESLGSRVWCIQTA